MNLLVFHVASGQAFFTGAAMILLGLAAGRTSRSGVRRLGPFAVILGVCLAVVSATPLPVSFYVGAIGLTLAAPLVARRFPERLRLDAVLRATAAAVWFGAAGWELSWQAPPAVPVASHGTLFVIGDSVSAGMGDRGETTWPRRLAEDRRIDVRDFSHVGATAGSALRQAGRVDGQGVVLVEIGGNDLLGPAGGTPAEAFERDLDALLTACAGPAEARRVVVMLELPLPPFANRYGEIQRRLSRRHGAALVPKRVFAAVLTTDGATLDSIHLSNLGQALMSERLWTILAPAFSGLLD